MGTASKRRAPRWDAWPLCAPRGWMLRTAGFCGCPPPHIRGALCPPANRPMACGFGVYGAMATHHLGVAGSPLS